MADFRTFLGPQKVGPLTSRDINIYIYICVYLHIYIYISMFIYIYMCVCVFVQVWWGSVESYPFPRWDVLKLHSLANRSSIDHTTTAGPSCPLGSGLPGPSFLEKQQVNGGSQTFSCTLWGKNMAMEHLYNSGFIMGKSTINGGLPAGSLTITRGLTPTRS